MKAKYPPTTGRTRERRRIESKGQRHGTGRRGSLKKKVARTKRTRKRQVGDGVGQPKPPRQNQHRPEARRPEAQQHDRRGEDPRHRVVVVVYVGSRASALLGQHRRGDAVAHGRQEDQPGVLNLPDRERERREHGEAALVNDRAQDDELAQRVDVRPVDRVAEDDRGVAVEARDAHDAVHQRVDRVVGEACVPRGRRSRERSEREGGCVEPRSSSNRQRVQR